MSAPQQIELWSQPETALAKFEARLREIRQPGLMLWTGVLRRIVARILERRESVYTQCMLLESEVEAGADSIVILERIGRIKGLVAAMLLALCIYQCVEGSALMRPREARPVKTARVRKGRELEDYLA
ncbi:hypothetical protein [Cerasicoccus arenae]|uniref:Uncharacterized protein n=1 Tax=Cerasicoccus arenae TaxID=424488 RepID=A0A8J3DBM9_9BACT|nr:hypothetical protein [Cerasicoccus arenae]MBK1858212.1 hypothetical protein [Cerasicoccus arenae]GHC01939.1 hypothetical protein GCM10007047_18000 [Cerasicoccus arenae]